MIEQGEIWTLDDNNPYVVASILDIDNKKYVYLIHKNDYQKYIIGEYTEEGIDEIEDPDLFETLLVKFNEDLKESLPTILSEYL